MIFTLLVSTAVATQPTATVVPWPERKKTLVGGFLAARLEATRLASPIPTATPDWPTMLQREYHQGYVDGATEALRGVRLPGTHPAQPTSIRTSLHGAWLVTATATRTPRPNPEAACVAVGHDWYYKDEKTYTMWALIPICHPNGTPWPCLDSQVWVWTQRCGRCGLRREHEWKEIP